MRTIPAIPGNAGFCISCSKRSGSSRTRRNTSAESEARELRILLAQAINDTASNRKARILRAILDQTRSCITVIQTCYIVAILCQLSYIHSHYLPTTELSNDHRTTKQEPRAFAALCDQIEAAGDPGTEGAAIAGISLPNWFASTIA